MKKLYSALFVVFAIAFFIGCNGSLNTDNSGKGGFIVQGTDLLENLEIERYVVNYRLSDGSVGSQESTRLPITINDVRAGQAFYTLRCYGYDTPENSFNVIADSGENSVNIVKDNISPTIAYGMKTKEVSIEVQEYGGEYVGDKMGQYYNKSGIAGKRYSVPDIPDAPNDYYIFDGWYWRGEKIDQDFTTTIYNNYLTAHWKCVNDLGYCAISDDGTIKTISGSEEKIKSIVLPDSVTKIGDNAFANCINLSEFTFNDQVTDIDWYAFDNCQSLTSLTIPSSVLHIGAAFGYCVNLENIDVSPFNLWYVSKDGCLFSKNEKYLECVPGGKSGVYDVPSGVTLIDNAFVGDDKITRINVPASVEVINDRGFVGCSSLECIVIDSENLKYCIYDDCLYTIDKKELLWVPPEKSSEIQFPDTLTRIGPYAFEGCKWITDLTVPDGVTELFLNYCDNLESVTIPVSVTNISLRGNASLTNIKYNGTINEWKNVVGQYLYWDFYYGFMTDYIACSDGNYYFREE